MRVGVRAILEGLSVTKSEINEAKTNNRPVTIDQFLSYAESQAKKYKAETAPWAVEMRKDFARTLYYAAMRALKPQGFDDYEMRNLVSNNLQSFFANNVRVDDACPGKWQQDLVSYVRDFKKNEKEWLDSRYKFTEENGKKYVQSFW